MAILPIPHQLMVTGMWKVHRLISHVSQDILVLALLQEPVSLQEIGMVVPHHVIKVSQLHTILEV